MIRLILVSILLVLLCASPALSFTGKVVGVTDGDTIKVLQDGTQVKIRLYGIDTPEKQQAFGQKAKDFTADMVAGELVDVEEVTKDRYGRTVGIVTLSGKNVNEELVRAGYAWVYTQYCDRSFCNDWKALETQAKTARMGLWEDSSPVPPWDWRKGESSGTSQPRAIPGEYHGNVQSKVFHQSSGRYYNCKNCTAVFQSRDQAISAGYKPCGICKP